MLQNISNQFIKPLRSKIEFLNMTDEVIVRKATQNDLDVLLNLEQDLISSERPFDPTIKKGSIHYYDLGKMLSDPQIEVVVAEYKKEIIASGYARIENGRPYLEHQQHAYLGFMYVKPEYRGMGINTRVVEKLKQFARSRGINEMCLDVYYQNEPAIKAYEKAGFEKHLIQMRMPV